jgi:3-phenylpropionate/trans-cinnamate dioxygenase ferredoxin reductase subunit
MQAKSASIVEGAAPGTQSSVASSAFTSRLPKGQLMPHYSYLIVGGGMAGQAAMQGIREVDAANPIGVVGFEAHMPYKRPPLSKGLWKGDPLDSIWYKADVAGVEFHLGRQVERIDPALKQVVDDRGETYTYSKLLLATGGTPRRLGRGGADDNVIYYRTLDDYQRLRAHTDAGQRFAIIGGGFIGSEVGAALALNGKQVVMAFLEEGIADRVLPRDSSLFLNDYYRQRGVTVLPNTEVANIERQGDKIVVHTRNGKTGERRVDEVDAVVGGLGITPNIELAKNAGLAVEEGVVVDEFLRTSQPDIYAAGDIALFYNPALDRRLRVEHENNARAMGKAAGKAMARHLAGAEAEPYHYLPFFYSDLFDVGYEAVGQVDSRLKTVSYWQKPHEQGVIYYLQNGRVRGALMWNVWKQLDAARKLIAEPGPFEPEDLALRVPWAPPPQAPAASNQPGGTHGA